VLLVESNVLVTEEDNASLHFNRQSVLFKKAAPRSKHHNVLLLHLVLQIHLFSLLQNSNAHLCHQQCQFILLLVGQLAQLDSLQLSSDVRSDLLNGAR
jgi:hypothetical protein